MTKAFYEYVAELDALKQRTNPTADDLSDLLRIIDGDEELAVWFYAENELEAVPGAGWVPLLKKAGQFEELGGVAGKATVLWRFKANYLAKSAAEQPDEVYGIITEVHPYDLLVQSRFLEALVSLPTEQAVRASWIIWDYLSGREYRVWPWVGKPAAKFMLKSLGSDSNLAFAIARCLLEIWSNEGESSSVLHDVTCRFENAYEYSGLMFKYFKKVWDEHPFRAVKLLIRILDGYLEEVSKKKGYDVSTHFHVSVENLDSIDGIDRDYEPILIRAICEAGKVVIKEEPDKTTELVRMLRATDRQIFKRIEMYLLRFVPSGIETARIEEIIADTDLFDSYGFKYEYALLVRDKAADISQARRNAFLELVEQTHVDNVERFAEWFKETRGREYAQEDLEKYENRMRAAKLYPVRKAFSGRYEEYREKAGAEDEELKPRPMVGPARWVSRTEGSPATVEEMVKKTPSEVFTYLADPSRWEVPKEGTVHFFNPKEALSSVFCNSAANSQTATFMAFGMRYGVVSGEKSPGGRSWQSRRLLLIRMETMPATEIRSRRCFLDSTTHSERRRSLWPSTLAPSKYSGASWNRLFTMMNRSSRVNKSEIRFNCDVVQSRAMLWSK